MKTNAYFSGIRSAAAVFVFAAAGILMAACAGGAPRQAAVEPAQEPVQAAASSSGARNTDVTLDQAIEQAAQEIESRLKADTKIAALSFNSPSGGLSEYVLEELSMYLVKGSKLSVVDRRNLDDVRTELNFNLTDEVADKSAQEAGRILGAQYIVTGTIQNLGDVSRIRFKTIAVESAGIAASSAATVGNDALVKSLLAQAGTINNPAAKVASPAAPASGTSVPAAAVTPATAPAPATSSSGYNVGDKGPAGGLVFYSTEPKKVSAVPAPANLATGDNGQASGLVFYTTEPKKVSTVPAPANLATGDNGPAGGIVFYPAAYIQTPPLPAGTVYQVGDTGPAGGIIFYANTGAGDWKYLEAAPASAEFTAQWSSSNGDVKGTAPAVGSGKKNQDLLLDFLNSNGLGGAAQQCDLLNINGFNDWFLPSQGELNMMYLNLKMKRLGGFGTGRYWSSTQENSGYGRYQNFNDGDQGYTSKGEKYLVRAIRQF
jgi:TolB-like protein